jgi:WD40 repeat protein
MNFARSSSFVVLVTLFACEAEVAQGSSDAVVLEGKEQGWPVSLAYAPNGAEFACVSSFGHVLLDTRTWKRGRRFDIGIRMLAYSPDGKTIVTAEGTDGARVWKADDPGKPTSARLGDVTEISELSSPERTLITPDEAGKSRRVFGTGFSADGARFFTTDAAGHVRIWESRTGKQEADIDVSKAEVRGAAFHPKGKLIAFGDVNGQLRVWDLEHQKVAEDVKTPSPIVSLTYNGNGTCLVTTHSDRSAMIWYTESWTAQVEAGAMAAAYAPDGKTLALGGAREVRLLSAGESPTTRTIALNAKPVSAMAWRSDGHALAVGCMDGSVHVLSID